MYFSIIIPAYNVEKYISKCLESIIEQSFKDFEVIVVDDESTDMTGEIIKEYSKKYSFIKYYRIKNTVVGEVRNKAIALATGNYLVFVDSDDYIESNMLERIFECLNGKNIDVCFLPNHYVDTDKARIANSLMTNADENNIYFYSNGDFVEYICSIKGTIPSAMWTAVCSRQLVLDKKIKMDKEFIWSQDSDYIYKVLEVSNNIAVCFYRGYIWNRQNLDSATRIIKSAKVISRLKVYMKWYNLTEKNCFGNISYESKEYIKGCLLRNYCDVLVIYSFMRNRKERKAVIAKIEDDALWNIDKRLLPYGYDRCGLYFGRYIFLLNHYFIEIKNRFYDRGINRKE